MQNCVMKTCFAEFNSAGMFGKGKQGVEELGQGKRGRDSAVIEIMQKYGLKLNTER